MAPYAASGKWVNPFVCAGTFPDKWGITKEYRAWVTMKTRCYNQNSASYPNYGGRGITVCDEWLESFDNFFNDLGPAPSKTSSLDRVKNHLNYSKENCRWSERTEQNRNRRNVMLTADDVRVIRKLRREGVPNKQIAAQFGLSNVHVSMITTNRIWKKL